MMSACRYAAWSASVSGAIAAAGLACAFVVRGPVSMDSMAALLVATVVSLLLAVAGLSVLNGRRRLRTRRGVRGRVVDGLFFMVWVASIATLFSYGVALAASHLPNGSLVYQPATRTIVLDGAIGSDTANAFQRMLAAHTGARTLVINSGGGLVSGADAIAREIHRDGLAVRVDGICASACVAIWAASTHREMTPGSRIGLHRGDAVVEIPYVSRWFVAAVSRLGFGYTHWLRQAGFGPATIDHMLHVPPDSIWWLTPAALRARGVRVAVEGTD